MIELLAAIIVLSITGAYVWSTLRLSGKVRDWDIATYSLATVQGLRRNMHAATSGLGRSPLDIPKIRAALASARANQKAWGEALQAFWDRKTLVLPRSPAGGTAFTVYEPARVLRAKFVIGDSMYGFGVKNGEMIIYYPIDGKELLSAFNAVPNASELLAKDEVLEFRIGRATIAVSKSQIIVRDPALEGAGFLRLARDDLFVGIISELDVDDLAPVFSELGIAGSKDDVRMIEKVRAVGGFDFGKNFFNILPVFKGPDDADPVSGSVHALSSLKGIVLAVKDPPLAP